jgi:hypothetical protein
MSSQFSSVAFEYYSALRLEVSLRLMDSSLHVPKAGVRPVTAEVVAEARTGSDMSQRRLSCVGSSPTAVKTLRQNALTRTLHALRTVCSLLRLHSGPICFILCYCLSFRPSLHSFRNTWPVQFRALVAITSFLQAIRL